MTKKEAAEIIIAQIGDCNHPVSVECPDCLDSCRATCARGGVSSPLIRIKLAQTYLASLEKTGGRMMNHKEVAECLVDQDGSCHSPIDIKCSECVPQIKKLCENAEGSHHLIKQAAIDYIASLDSQEQPAPIANDNPHIADLVMADIMKRKQKGIETYGVPLQAHNGRDALQDAYEEALDLCCYLRQAMEERR